MPELRLNNLNNNKVDISLHNELWLKLDTTNYEFLDSVKEYFTEFVEGYRYQTLYKLHRWDGKKSLFSSHTRLLPYGLLTDLIKHTKKEFPDIQLILSDAVKSLYRGCENPDITWNLSRYPRNYQEDCIRTAIKHSKGCFVVTTSGGKSAIIAYIIKELIKLGAKRSIIIVPTLSLVEQFHTDLVEYGMYPELLGKVNSKHKEFDKTIVISTWASLRSESFKKELYLFECVVVDETHQSSAKTLHDALQLLVNAKWRFGFTGTMPKNRLDELMVKSFLGPVLRTYNAKDLSEDGFISKCTINMMHIEYIGRYAGEYNDVKDKVLNNPYRLGLITDICEKTNHTILILVDKITYGEKLEEILVDKFTDRKVIFLSGRDNVDTREEWRQQADKDDNVIIIGIYQVYQQGINIPSLKTMILASPSKSYIRIIQSIGRTLRKHECKEESGSIVYDLVDKVKFLNKHAEIRYRHYSFENHNITEWDLKESHNNYSMVRKEDL